ncbi:lipopolysaccharide assembly protein LapA domain-containing protein [Formosa maritima]|uniref:LapA family protein n=1 Tax=Formosa maritima TaxID=2592046 RepID=A0A5D0G347_9FLAO|nr:LapA family protein [Formosa maritima]TYA53101.1 LapA family protein [Formosa maritima]
MNTKAIIAIILILLIVTFTMQNTEVVTIKLLTFDISMSLVLVILGCFLLGLLSGVLLSYRKRSKNKIEKV